MFQPWISHEGASILCLDLMKRPFGQDCVLPWNLACVPFDHDGFLEWDSFTQPWFMPDDRFSSISLMVHSAKSGQPMYGSNLGSRVNLLGACIRFDFGCINEYEFWTHGIQSWLELIKMLRSFSYKDQQNILLKLKGKFIHYCPYYLEEYLATNKEVF